MGFIWRSWRTDTKAGVSGWDPSAPPTLFMSIPSGVAAVITPSLGLSWLLALGFFAFAILALLTLRYLLVISSDGYKLSRAFFFIVPWKVRKFSRRASVNVEYDDSDYTLSDVGLQIAENPGSVGASSKGEKSAVSFGVEFHCLEVVYRIHALAFAVGCTDIPPGDDPNIVKIAVPTMTRRMRWRRKATHENN